MYFLELFPNLIPFEFSISSTTSQIPVKCSVLDVMGNARMRLVFLRDSFLNGLSAFWCSLFPSRVRILSFHWCSRYAKAHCRLQNLKCWMPDICR